MKLLADIRRENFEALAQEAGSQAALARRIGKDKNQVNQWLGRGKARNMSSESAREIESAMLKPHGWMDQDRSATLGRIGEAEPPSYAPRLNHGTLSASIRFLEDQFRLWGKEFVAADRALLIAAVYDRLSTEPESNRIELSQWLADRVKEEGDDGKGKAGSFGGDDRQGDQRRAG
jgi:hypothetical protein